MRVSGKKQVAFVDPDLYRPSRIRVQGKRGTLDFKRVRECKCGSVDGCRSYGIQTRNIVYREIAVLATEL
jgi:hypothetical protein